MKRLSAFAVAALAGLVLSTSAVWAQVAAAPDLGGELFQAVTTPDTPGGDIGSVQATARRCDPDGTGSVTFAAVGPAEGPYTGTFRESAQISWGPHPPNLSAPVLDASATFLILSPTAIVVGTKTLNAAAPPFTSAARCQALPSGEYLDMAANVEMTYQATIFTRTGRCTDRGFATLSYFDQGPASPGQNIQAMVQRFRTDGVLPVCESNEEDDGDDDEDDEEDDGDDEEDDEEEDDNG